MNARQMKPLAADRTNTWSRYFNSGDWWRLPTKLRQRWWNTTDYGRLQPPAKLVEEIREHLNGGSRPPGEGGTR